MSKRFPGKHPRREGDFYPTIARAPVEALMPYLRGVRRFAEPCAGAGDLKRSLESFGLECVYAGDIATGQDALAVDSYGDVDAVITNPPHSKGLLLPLLRHFLRVGSVFWLLLPHDWITNKWAVPFLTHATDIVAMPRIQWLADKKSTGTDNHIWVRFDPRHTAGPVFHPRGRLPGIVPRRATTCTQCGNPYRPGRADQRFCSAACKQRAYRERAVT